MKSAMTEHEVVLTTLLHVLIDDKYRARVGPLGLLRAMKPVRSTLDKIEEQAVCASRAAGHSWSEIADALGEPKASVHRRWKDVS